MICDLLFDGGVYVFYEIDVPVWMLSECINFIFYYNLCESVHCIRQLVLKRESLKFSCLCMFNCIS